MEEILVLLSYFLKINRERKPCLPAKGTFHSAPCFVSYKPSVNFFWLKLIQFFLIPFNFLLGIYLKLFLPKGDSYHSGQENRAKNKLYTDLVYFFMCMFQAFTLVFLDVAATSLREAHEGRRVALLWGTTEAVS